MVLDNKKVVLNMIDCRFCSRTSQTLRGYVLHCKVHRNEPRCVFKCESTDCRQTFCTYAAFKGHFYRKHNVPAPSNTGTAIISNFICAMSLCSERFQTVQELLVHLKRHLVEGRSVTCPVAGCQSTFTLKSSFTNNKNVTNNC